MIEIPLQITQEYQGLSVMSTEDKDKLKVYSVNQIVRAKLYGVEKPRSYQQLKLYWACCRKVAENLENTFQDDIDFEVKIQVAKKHPGMIRRFRSIGGITYMEPISIAYMNMKHLEACRFFDLAFPIMAKMIGVTVDELLANEND